MDQYHVDGSMSESHISPHSTTGSTSSVQPVQIGCRSRPKIIRRLASPIADLISKKAYDHGRDRGSMRFKCPIEKCNFSFDVRYKLNSHLRFHTKEKPYRCMGNDCSRAFKWRSSLVKHRVSHNRLKSSFSKQTTKIGAQRNSAQSTKTPVPKLTHIQSCAWPVIKPVIKPVIEPGWEPGLRPVLGPVLGPLRYSVTNPSIDMVVNPVSIPAIEPVSSPVRHPVTNLVMEHVSNSMINPVIDPVMNPV
eukprot:IDg2263t1